VQHIHPVKSEEKKSVCRCRERNANHALTGTPSSDCDVNGWKANAQSDCSHEKVFKWQITWFTQRLSWEALRRKYANGQTKCGLEWNC
jgi:hypothetical protein